MTDEVLEEKGTLQIEQCMMCPICGMGKVAEGDPVFVTQYHGVNLAYAKCTSCEGYWLVNRMPESFQEEYYRDFYRKITTPTKEMFDLSLLAEEMRARKQLDFIKDELPLVESVLDFGSASGAMLQMLKNEYQKDVVGIEIGVNGQSERAKELGLPIFGSLNELQGRKFDLIILSHVLEHMNYPVKFLVELMKSLNLGGSMLIDVPNVHADRSAMILHHPIAFSFTSMYRMLDVLGLRIEEFMKYDWEHTPIERSMLFLVRRDTNADGHAIWLGRSVVETGVEVYA